MTRVSRICLAIGLVLAAVFIAPATVLAFNGEIHEDAVGKGLDYFRPSLRQTGDLPPIEYGARPIFPELEAASEYYNDEGATDDPDTWMSLMNREWAFSGATAEDHYDTEYDGFEVPILSLSHFWDADLGVMKTTGLKNIANAWLKAEEMWIHAVDHWNAGDTGFAYLYLGKCLHLLSDQGQPAHPHGDLHMGHDSLEDWAGRQAGTADSLYPGPMYMFSWTDPARDPGPALFVTRSDIEIYQDILAHPAIWGDYGQEFSHEDCPNGPTYDHLLDPNETYGLHRVFYLMWRVNQVADSNASDQFEGDQQDELGSISWDLFPATVTSTDQLLDNDTTDCSTTDPHDPTTTLCQTESGREECNWDYDFSKIMDSSYRTAFRSVPAMIEVFRLTVDNRAPETTVETTRADGEAVVEWNNSPVTVELVDALDNANVGMRPSGVWKKWAVADDGDGTLITPDYTPAPEEMPYLLIDQDGMFTVNPMTTDMCGNIEQGNDFMVGVDLTPPEIAFPDLRPNYLTSQTFVPLWDAWDVTSGIDHVTAYLDGMMIDEGTPVALARKAGTHRLSVWAWDKAGNWRHEVYDFEVWIDTATEAQPVYLNTSTKGTAVMVSVEFPGVGTPRRHRLPALYDVGAIDVTTCRLSIDASIDLYQPHPVVDAITTLEGTLLTGVGDNDGDGVRDRMIRFDKHEFAAAVAGRTGDVQAVVWGGLLPDGSPRFIGVVTIPVFTTPK